MTASRMRDGIIRRGRGWAFVLDLPPDPATGKRRQKWVGGFRTRTDAQRARNEARAKADRGAWRAPGRLTVGGYLGEVWLPAIPAKVAVSTLISYRQILPRWPPASATSA